MTISCPRCGLAFESRATTATRCPSCRTVVHISRGTSSVRSSSSQATSRAARSSSDSQPEEGGGGIVIVAFVVLGGWLLWQWWRSRRPRPDETGQYPDPAAGPYTFARPAPTTRPVDPDVGQAPPAATAEPDATRAHTGPNKDKPGQLA